MTALQQRTLLLRLGDWSGDGHSITEDVLVTVSGEDVSDERLRAGQEATDALLGTRLFSLFEGYEESSLPPGLLAKLEEAGFHEAFGQGGEVRHLYPRTWCEESEQDLGVVALVLWWCGRTIPGFQWQVVEVPLLLGGSRTVLRDGKRGTTSLGYGLFQ